MHGSDPFPNPATAGRQQPHQIDTPDHGLENHNLLLIRTGAQARRPRRVQDG
jgi:hypothetical protein